MSFLITRAVSLCEILALNVCLKHIHLPPHNHIYHRDIYVEHAVYSCASSDAMGLFQHYRIYCNDAKHCCEDRLCVALNLYNSVL